MTRTSRTPGTARWWPATPPACVPIRAALVGHAAVPASCLTAAAPSVTPLARTSVAPCARVTCRPPLPGDGITLPTAPPLAQFETPPDMTLPWITSFGAIRTWLCTLLALRPIRSVRANGTRHSSSVWITHVTICAVGPALSAPHVSRFLVHSAAPPSSTASCPLAGRPTATACFVRTVL